MVTKIKSRKNTETSVDNKKALKAKYSSVDNPPVKKM